MSVSIAIGAVRTWVALYTFGLPSNLRDERRTEVDCDLWEQRLSAHLQGERALATAGEVVLRLILGMISDIMWRVQASLSARSDRSMKVNESLTARGLFCVALVVAALPLVFGLSIMARYPEPAGVLYGLGQALSAGILIGGLAFSSTRPQLGLAMVALGVLGVTAFMFWMFMITIPVGILLLGVAYYRAHQTGWGWPRGAGTA
jgi:hypothetical protein